MQREAPVFLLRSPIRFFNPDHSKKNSTDIRISRIIVKKN